MKKNFNAIAGILFGAAALQFLCSIMSCVEVGRGRRVQKQREEEERVKAAQAQAAAHPQGAYAPPAAYQPGVAAPQYAADHRY